MMRSIAGVAVGAQARDGVVERARDADLGELVDQRLRSEPCQAPRRSARCARSAASTPISHGTMTENVSVAGSRPGIGPGRARRRHAARRTRPASRRRCCTRRRSAPRARAVRGRASPPMMIGGCGRCTGLGRASSGVQAVVRAGEGERPVGPDAADDRELLLEQLHARPERRELEAVGLVLALVPAGAEAELDAPVRDVVDGSDVLGEHRRVAERRRRDEHAEAQAGRDRREPRHRRPGSSEPRSSWPADREVVIRAEQRADAVLLAGLRERDPLRPGHVLLALDHQLDAHCRQLRGLRARSRATPRRPRRRSTTANGVRRLVSKYRIRKRTAR